MHRSTFYPRRAQRGFAGLAWCLLTVFAVSAVGGCDHPEIKKYTAARDKTSTDETRIADYHLPEGWIRQSKPAELSMATFQASGADKQVAITLSVFPGKLGGLYANIARWRKKIGLPPGEEEQMAKDILWVNIDGEKTPYVDLANPAKEDADRILGVVAYKGPVTWVFYMHGPPEQVSRQKAAFLAFVESVKFGDNGANDG